MSDKPWLANGPEDRLSIAVDRFLSRALVPPFYCTAIHDADHGKRTDLQRIRDANRGIRKGQLDWECWQGPGGLARRVELKRGYNKPTEAQDGTIADLTACGAPPIVAWSLRDVWCGLTRAGFRFFPNVATTLQHWEEQLAAWDREAELVKSGAIVKKRSTARPRVRTPKDAVARAFKAGAWTPR